MDKLSFFLLALANKAYTRKDWVIKCFSYFIEDPEIWRKDPYPFRVIRHEGRLAFISQDGTIVPITDSDGDSPLLTFKAEIVLKAGSVPNLTMDVISTYGLLFVNYSTLVYGFGTKIPYQNTEIFASKIEKIIEPIFESDVEPGAVESPDKIYVHEYKRFCEAVFQLGGYSQLCVPSASPKTLTGNPEGLVLRDRLLKENANMLHDPATVARISKQLEELDRKWVDDDGKDFYIKSKAYTDTRMKAHYMHGLERPFVADEKAVLIRNSLEEGWELKDLPAMVNSLREGSFSRGSETQLGGVAAKEALRAFQNVNIAEKDCGTLLGLPFTVTADNSDMFVGFYHIVNGELKEINAETVIPLINQKIYVRTPMLCKTSHTDFCEVCMGKQNSLNPTGLNALSADVGSTFLKASMKRMHVSAITLARYRPEISIQ